MNKQLLFFLLTAAHYCTAMEGPADDHDHDHCSPEPMEMSDEEFVPYELVPYDSRAFEQVAQEADVRNDNQVRPEGNMSFASLMKATWKNETPAAVQDITQVGPVSQTPYGTDPLGWTAFHGNLIVTSFLLQLGFRPITRQDGSTAIHVAAYHDKADVLEYLLTYPHFMPVDGDTALERKKMFLPALKDAAPRLYTELERFLTRDVPPGINQGKVPTTKQGKKQFFEVLMQKHMGWLKEMLEKKISVEGFAILLTPYGIAQHRGNAAVMKLLKPQTVAQRMLEAVADRYRQELHYDDYFVS